MLSQGDPPPQQYLPDKQKDGCMDGQMDPTQAAALLPGNPGSGQHQWRYKERKQAMEISHQIARFTCGQPAPRA
jgi:hypothetical protein